MKILKTFLLFLAFISAGNSFGQTKEETIAWLKEKLNNNLYNYSGGKEMQSIKLLAIDECSITVIYNLYVYDGTRRTSDYEQITEEIPTNHIEKGIRGFEYPADLVIKKNLTKNTEVRYSETGFKIGYKEVDIENRILKAIKHLATFCEKKKETF